MPHIVDIVRSVNTQTKDLAKIKQTIKLEIDVMKVTEIFHTLSSKIASEKINPNEYLLKSVLLSEQKKFLLNNHLVSKFLTTDSQLIKQYNKWIDNKELTKPMAKLLYNKLIYAITHYQVIEIKSLYHSFLNTILDEIITRENIAQQKISKLQLSLEESKTKAQNKHKVAIAEKQIKEAIDNAEAMKVEKFIGIQDIVYLCHGLNSNDTQSLLSHPVITRTPSLGSNALYAVIISEAAHANATKFKTLLEMLPAGGIVKMARQIPKEQITKLLKNLQANTMSDSKKQQLVIKPLQKSGLVANEELESYISVKRSAREMEEEDESLPDQKSIKSEDRADSGMASANDALPDSDNDDYRPETPIDPKIAEAINTFTPIKSGHSHDEDMKVDILGLDPVIFDNDLPS